MDLGLPAVADLDSLLGLSGGHVAEQVEKRLIAPARALLNRHSKQMRGRLVELGFELAGGKATDTAAVERAAAAMELLHAGSLIVDDIQDGSRQRRGGQSLHLLYGVPTALCTGNWLYFWPMRLLGDLPLSVDKSYRVLRAYHEAVEQAHYGQALDLTVKVDTLPRQEVPALCDAVIGWKTGTITSLAMRIGALIAGADATVEKALADFGMSFGKTLQYFDDLGNVMGRLDPGKRFEDLRLRKPTAVWAMAAARSTDEDYSVFRAAALRVDDDPAPLLAWFNERGFVADATVRLNTEMNAAINKLGEALAALTPPEQKTTQSALERLRDLTEELIDAY